MSEKTTYRADPTRLDELIRDQINPNCLCPKCGNRLVSFPWVNAIKTDKDNYGYLIYCISYWCDFKQWIH